MEIPLRLDETVGDEVRLKGVVDPERFRPVEEGVKAANAEGVGDRDGLEDMRPGANGLTGSWEELGVSRESNGDEGRTVGVPCKWDGLDGARGLLLDPGECELEKWRSRRSSMAIMLFSFSFVDGSLDQTGSDVVEPLGTFPWSYVVNPRLVSVFDNGRYMGYKEDFGDKQRGISL